MIALDTNALIAFAELPSTSLDEARHAAARSTVLEARLRGTDIVLPSLVIAEILNDYDTNKNSELLRWLTQVFTVRDFGLSAAERAAELYRQAIEARQRIVMYAGKPHTCLVTDIAIAAVALEAGCEVLYTYDHDLQRFGAACLEGRLRVEPFPNPPITRPA